MRIREVPTSPSSPKDTRIPAQPNLDFLMDRGLLEGLDIDPADQVKSKPATSQFASSAPESSLSPEQDGWIRQEFPSLGVPYELGSSFWVRPLTVPMLARLHAAQEAGSKKGGNQRGLTLLLDAITPTIKDFDIRDLTVPDFFAFLYWLRINSYPRSPFTVPWTSRYGNENVTRLGMSSFVFEELKMTAIEYKDWAKRGIAFPTIRDFEVLSDTELQPDLKWMMQYAQYMKVEGPIGPDLMQRKIEKFEELGTDAISYVNEFAKLCTHGVVEQVTVRDAKFDLNEAIDYIEREIAKLTLILEEATKQSDGSDQETLKEFLFLGTHIEQRMDELKGLREARDNGGVGMDGKKIQAEEEVVALAPASAALLFP